MMNQARRQDGYADVESEEEEYQSGEDEGEAHAVSGIITT